MTRHNAGAWFVDRLAERINSSFRRDVKFHGESARSEINGLAIHLLKPGTFMNRSGQAVVSISQYFKIPVENILVVHDELDLPVGTVRLKKGGGHGGHNGLRDIIAALGRRNDFMRLRIGIGHPGHRNDVSDYVLSEPGKKDKQVILDAVEEACDVMGLVASGEYEKAMHRLHS